MQTRERWIAATVTVTLVALGLLVPASHAQQRYDEEPLPERFGINIGGFLVNRFDTTFRLDSTQVPIGTVIDLEDVLNVDSKADVLRIDGTYRFNKKSRIDFGWFRSDRDGFVEVREDITIGDPDTGEEIVISAGASVSSNWKFSVLNVTYNYSFVNTWRYEAFIGAGLNMNDLQIELQGDFDLSGIGDFTESERVEASGFIPLPVAVIGARYNFSRRWRVDFREQWLQVELGDFRGTISDTLLVFQHHTFKNVGFAFGLNTYVLDVEAEGDDLRGTVESSYSGFVFAVKVYTGGRRG